MRTTKEFTAVVIGHRTEEAKRYKINLDAKIKALEEFYNYVGKFISTEDRKTFDANLYDVFIQRFSNRYSNDFPHISLNKMFGLMDVNTDKINSLIQTISSIDIDAAAAAPDWNIYTESEEQNKLYKYLQNIIENIDHLKETRNIFPAPLISGFNGMFQFDFTTNKIVPSIPFIKGERLRL